MKTFLLIAVAVLCGVLVGRADSAQHWMMTAFTATGGSRSIEVHVVDSGPLCLYVTVGSFGGYAAGSTAAIWGIEKYKLGGKCQ